jgi:hypothetical protein
VTIILPGLSDSRVIPLEYFCFLDGVRRTSVVKALDFQVVFRAEPKRRATDTASPGVPSSSSSSLSSPTRERIENREGREDRAVLFL